jgi:phage-related baseplate assembly protein
MPKNKNTIIKYTSRDFESIKEDLVDHAKRYYSDTYRDFTDASFGSMILDTVAYTGDILSYYLDYHVNESFLDTSLEFDNVRKHARAFGYKFSGTPSSFGTISLFILCPANTEGNAPDTSYLPIMKAGSSFSTANGGNFILTEDVDFSDPSADLVAARFNPTTGATTYFAVRAYGQIQSGFLQRATVDLTNSTFEKFKKIRVGEPSICEIISVYDSDGNRYYEVDNLAQEVIFVDTTNKNAANDGIRSILKPFATTRRFTVEQDDTGTYLQFGFGSADEDDSGVVNPASVALKMHGKNYISSKSFDPTKLMSTNKLGISPYNTELVIVFRSNTVDTTNVAANTVNVVNRVRFVYKDVSVLTSTQRNFLENSLEVNNDNPITSISVDISVDELKQRAKSHYAAQNRAVTKQDYESLVYNMPAKFGAITRASIINDPSSTNRRMSLYVISQDSDGNLALAGDVVKNNLKNWINQFRAVNDQIEIMNPKIINFGIDFVVMTDKRFSQNSVLTECVEELKDLFSDKLYIGEPIYLSRIYERLNRIDGVVDVRKVSLYNKNDGAYSSVFLDFDKVLSRDGTYIETPKNAIMELKFPDLDIKGTAK